LVSPCDGSPARPHALWFDESYDERHFRYRSALAAVARATLVIVVGRSGATNLPAQIVQHAYAQRVPLLVINRDPSRFSELAQRSAVGHFYQGAASESLPALAAAIAASIA
jgi:NAD-dependent deacetylase